MHLKIPGQEAPNRLQQNQHGPLAMILIWQPIITLIELTKRRLKQRSRVDLLRGREKVGQISL